MASCSAERQLNEFPVCIDKFLNPKILPCHHTFCEFCINRIFDTGLLACPLCHKPFARNEVVFDFCQGNIVDAFEKPENCCEFCGTSTIQFWCENCALLICELCSRNHFKDHPLIRFHEKEQEIRTEMRTGLIWRARLFTYPGNVLVKRSFTSIKKSEPCTCTMSKLTIHILRGGGTCVTEWCNKNEQVCKHAFVNCGIKSYICTRTCTLAINR